MKYLYDPPFLIKKLFNGFSWNTKNQKLLLTFDDGPNAGTTEMILKQLDNMKIKAMFFCVGENVKRFPQLAKEIIVGGHTIGNHTFNHKVLKTISYDERVEQITSFNNLLKNSFDYDVKYFRPPHGKFQLSTRSMLDELSLKNVMWSLLTYDYKNSIDVVKFAVREYLKKDSIIVLHDSEKSKQVIRDSISVIADEADKRGFVFGDAEECLK